MVMKKVLFRNMWASTAPVFFLAVVLCISCPAAAEAGEKAYIVGLATYPLREEPQFANPAISRLKVGERIEILERIPGWVRIKADGQVGWLLESVVDTRTPAEAELAPLRQRLGTLETGLDKATEENGVLTKENEKLTGEVTVLQRDLDDSRRLLRNSRSYQRLWGVALGGGLVIFGWITGYALAARSRKKSSSGKYTLS